MEKVAGTLILMRNSDSGPASESFIEQLQKEACEDREKPMRQVQQYTYIAIANNINLLTMYTLHHSCSQSRREKHS